MLRPRGRPKKASSAGGSAGARLTPSPRGSTPSAREGMRAPHETRTWGAADPVARPSEFSCFPDDRPPLLTPHSARTRANKGSRHLYCSRSSFGPRRGLRFAVAERAARGSNAESEISRCFVVFVFDIRFAAIRPPALRSLIRGRASGAKGKCQISAHLETRESPSKTRLSLVYALPVNGRFPSGRARRTGFAGRRL